MGLVDCLRWLVAIFKQQPHKYLELLRPTISKMKTILLTRGKVQLIDWCKNHRLALLHYLSGESKSKIVRGVPLDKDGFPRNLGFQVKKAIATDTLLLRLLLTLLFSTRLLSVGKDCSTKSITAPVLSDDLSDISKYTVDFWRTLGYRPSDKVPTRLKWKGYHFTTKAGPSKGQALNSSMTDLVLVKADNQLLKSIWILGGRTLEKKMKLLISCLSILPKSLFPRIGTSLRRVTWFSAQETKVRVVAILDYWSQTALRPLHDYLFGVLRVIPQDCTFDQGSFLDKVKDWSEYYSIDLTAATDRFPLTVISFVLKGLLPKSFVDAWEYVMVGIPFDFEQSKISYNAGQPMGAYSSWNSFAVAHHYIMYWCCRELGIRWEDSKYVMLGDDVLIGDARLAMKYKETMARLGVEISAMKTHESSKLFEFAKRLVLQGTEITPFPISAIVECSKKTYLLTNLLMAEERRGWNWPTGIPKAIEEFNSRVLKLSSRVAAKARDSAFLSLHSTLVLRGLETARDALASISGQFNVQLPPLPEKGYENIFSEVAKEVFDEKGSLDYMSGQPLGQLALEQTIALTGVDYSSSMVGAPDDIPSAIPILGCYGLVEEKYLDITRQISDIYRPGSSGWPMALRALTIPVSDKVFVERSSNTVARVGAVFGQRILNCITIRFGKQHASIPTSICLG